MDIPFFYVLYMSTAVVVPAACVLATVRRGRGAAKPRAVMRGTGFAEDWPRVSIRVLAGDEQADESEAAAAAAEIESRLSMQAAEACGAGNPFAPALEAIPAEAAAETRPGASEEACTDAPAEVEAAVRRPRVRQLQLALP